MRKILCISGKRFSGKFGTTAKLAMAVKPWACTNENTRCEPFRTVIAVGGAGIRSVVIVAIGAFGSSSYADHDLSLNLGSARCEAGSNNSGQSKTFKTVHEFTSQPWGP